MNKRTIGECFYQIRNGANIKQGMVEGGFPITRIETIANDKFNRDRMGYAGITDAEKYKKYILEDGDLLMSHINSAQYLGRTVLYKKNGDEKIIHGMNLLGLKANREIIEPAYAKYYFYSKPFREQINRITKKSVNQASFAVADLKRLTILVPPLSKQHEVVDVLDKINKIITFRQQQLAKLDELVKARFVEMFSDTRAEEPLATLCTFIDYRGKTPEKAERGLPFITAKNIKMHHMSFETKEFISKETYDKVMTRGFPKVGDVVFTTEAPLGNVCRIPYMKTEFYIGQRIITMQTKALEPVYLEYALSSDDFKRKILEKSSGSTVTGIRSKLLEQLTIPVPPIAQQQKFAAFVGQIEKIRLFIQKNIEKIETLKKALMQKYFE